MKTLHYLILLAILIGNTTMGQNIQKIVDEVRQKLAPDKRTAIFEINLDEQEKKIDSKRRSIRYFV